MDFISKVIYINLNCLKSSLKLLETIKQKSKLTPTRMMLALCLLPRMAVSFSHLAHHASSLSSFFVASFPLKLGTNQFVRCDEIGLKKDLMTTGRHRVFFRNTGHLGPLLHTLNKGNEKLLFDGYVTSPLPRKE